MPHYNEVYISPQDFEICLHHGMRYDGFVEGLGYAYTSNFTIPPVHFQKYNPPGRVHDDQSFFQNGFIQYLDTSPEMRLMSVKYQHKVKTGDTLTSISAKYGISIQSIKDANAGIDWERVRRGGDLIFAGEELELPILENRKDHIADKIARSSISGRNSVALSKVSNEPSNSWWNSIETTIKTSRTVARMDNGLGQAKWSVYSAIKKGTGRTNVTITNGNRISTSYSSSPSNKMTINFTPETGTIEFSFGLVALGVSGDGELTSKIGTPSFGIEHTYRPTSDAVVVCGLAISALTLNFETYPFLIPLLAK